MKIGNWYTKLLRLCSIPNMAHIDEKEYNNALEIVKKYDNDKKEKDLLKILDQHIKVGFLELLLKGFKGDRDPTDNSPSIAIDY